MYRSWSNLTKSSKVDYTNQGGGAVTERVKLGVFRGKVEQRVFFRCTRQLAGILGVGARLGVGSGVTVGVGLGLGLG